MRGRNFYSSVKLLHNHVPLSGFGGREIGRLEMEVSVDRGIVSRGVGPREDERSWEFRTGATSGFI